MVQIFLITALKLKWSSVYLLKGLDIATVLEKHSEVFNDELECITDKVPD